MATAHVILVRPQIATNTGNIIRLCANTGATLHLVEPLGFRLDEASVRRAGLDYHELTTVEVHHSLATALAATGSDAFGFTANAPCRYDTVDFALGATMVFGAERDGLAAEDLDRFAADHLLHLPMAPDNRSLNLANSVAIAVYELWRQHHFVGGSPGGRSAETVSV